MTSQDNSKYDELLMRVLCEEKSIPDFLNILFGFLYRRTDLFVQQTGLDQKFGYPPGQCEKLIYDCMKHFHDKAIQRNQSGEEMQLFDQVIQDEVEIESAEDILEETVVDHTTEQAIVTETSHSASFSQSEKSIEKMSKPKTEGIQSSEECGSPHMLLIKRAATLSSSSSYNGADRSSFAWSQTLTDLEVEVRIAASVLKSRQIAVQVTASNICVRVDENELLNGKLPHSVKQDETVWTLTPGKYVQIHLEKSQEHWWDQLVESEPKLNLQAIDSTRAFSELSQEEQMKVNEIVWNDYQKSQGMPTSEQIKKANLLKKAWDSEGSPFKGRPFDPNIIH